jgi:pimeloyl-ACP methyl ester carboxylesterase
MAESDIVVREQYVTTADGWSLKLRNTVSPRHFDRNTKPLLIVPGYGMNSFIFSFHPRGTSMERCLAEGGYEVWAMDLRGQGESFSEKPRPGVTTLQNYAAVDLPAAIDRVLSRTETGARSITLVGCSLGGSIGYAYLALTGPRRVSEVITMGAPLRWTEVHPLLRVAFASPALAGALKLSNTRKLLQRAFPLLSKFPSLLGIYMNPASIDTTQMQEMMRTVEDPDPQVNRDIAVWIKNRDMSFDGINVTDAMRAMRLPLLVVLSNKDGIVPARTALTAADAWGGESVEILEVGDDDNWYAHANLFVADDAPRLVFDPILSWLRRHAAR